jgi:hypothetical protein
MAVDICIQLQQGSTTAAPIACKYILLNEAGTFATLKRGPSLEERKIFEQVSRMEQESLSSASSALALPLSSWRKKREKGQVKVKIRAGNREGNGNATDDGDGEQARQPLINVIERNFVSEAKLKETLRSFDPSDSALCKGGELQAKTKEEKESENGGEDYSSEDNDDPLKFLKSSSLAIAALSYRTPATLLNSMLSWDASHLLAITAENLIILNDPLPSEIAIAKAFNFDVVQPNDIPNAVMNGENRLTIATAFYYSLNLLASEYVLFLEKDFAADASIGSEEFMEAILTGIYLLSIDATWFVRLRSQAQQGCDSFKSCGTGANWKSSRSKDRR